MAERGARFASGSRSARGTIIAIQDADLELDPVQLAGLVQPILDGEADVVYGSRFLEGRPPGPWLSVAANRALTVADERAVRRHAHRHGDLLQNHEGPARAGTRPRIEPLRYRAGDHGEAAAARAGSWSGRSPSTRSNRAERQENRLARRISCDRGAGEIQIPAFQ